IAKQADGIELRALDGHANSIIMPVGIFAFAAVTAKRVPGRKCFFHADLKHACSQRHTVRPYVCAQALMVSGTTRRALPTEKPRAARQFVGLAVRRERLQENLTIRHALNTRIQQGQNPSVRLGADQPAKALFECQNRLRHLKLSKRIAAVLLQGVYSRGDNRIAGDREGQTVDDHARKLFAGDVDTLPETRGREQHSPWRIFEALQQYRSRRCTLQQQRKRHPRSHTLEQIVHLGIAGEQTKRAAFAELEELYDFIGSGDRESRVAHIGNGSRQIEEGLLSPVELWRQAAFLSVVQSQPLADVLESATDRESRGGHYDGVKLLKQALAQDLTDINGCGRQKDAFIPPLIPIDEISLVRLEEKRQLLPKLETPAGNAQEFFGL